MNPRREPASMRIGRYARATAALFLFGMIEVVERFTELAEEVLDRIDRRRSR